MDGIQFMHRNQSAEVKILDTFKSSLDWTRRCANRRFSDEVRCHDFLEKPFVVDAPAYRKVREEKAADKACLVAK
ncbi:hypothetical protein OH492_12975 [Vibrio chagasii]|nr:hypothetical protein [Vibrio chagasii]